jgi:hypothetical protein
VGPTRAPGLFDVEESARRIGNYKWAETKLFEALGGWIATVPELDVKMRLGRTATSTRGTPSCGTSACPSCAR